jgi:IS5 family transposase
MLQQFYNLSDPELEVQIKDRFSFQKFLGISFEEPVPDETTFCRFRQRLNDAGIFGLLFDEINRQLEGKGIMLKKGSIVDASIIESRNKDSDPEGRWIRYHNSKRSKFGYKLHVSCDPKRQLIQDLELTPASTADTNVMEQVVPYEATRVYGDKAYDSYRRRHMLRREGKYNGILLRYPRTPEEKERNKRLSKIRSRVERCFAHLKNVFGYRHVRYRGLIRNKGHAYLLAMAYNMKRALAMQAI